MACPCCQRLYCLRQPCSKYGWIKATWAGMTAEVGVPSSEPNAPRPARPGSAKQERDDRSCVQQEVEGFFPYFNGVRFVLIIGRPAGIDVGGLEGGTICYPSTIDPDGFTVVGEVQTWLSAFVPENFRNLYNMFAFKCRYVFTNNGLTVEPRTDLGGGPMTVRDVRDLGWPTWQPDGPCNDFLEACLAWKDVPPKIEFIQTGTGRVCGGTDKDSRGFPAVGGPYGSIEQCQDECLNPLP